MEKPDVIKEYPRWFIDMMQDLCDMRDAQRSYFESATTHKMRVAKLKEGRIDAYVDHYVKMGLIAHKPDRNNENQTKLF
ncbi:MAG: hypothetical protein QM768_21690 [Agriterribacter sp.]